MIEREKFISNKSCERVKCVAENDTKNKIWWQHKEKEKPLIRLSNVKLMKKNVYIYQNGGYIDNNTEV